MTVDKRGYTKVFIYALVGLMLWLPAQSAKSDNQPQEVYRSSTNQYLVGGVALNPGYALETPPLPIPKLKVQVCSCVAGINAHYGTNFRTLDGFARSIPTNSSTPAATGFVVTFESSGGHIAHYYTLGSKIIVDWEINYTHLVPGDCPVTSGRELPAALVKGFIN